MKEQELKKDEHREYEVEVRASIPERDFDNLLVRLSHLFGKPAIDEIKTFLFAWNSSITNLPSGYSRIRIIKNSNYGVLTEKIGDYTDKAREEINRDFGFDEVDSVIEELKSKGLTECSYLRSTGYAFSALGNQKLFLSKHQYLGNFLEVEILVNKQSEINEAYRAVAKTLANLKLVELPAVEYQGLMDQMYTKTLKPVSKYRNEISSF